jgi:hypothetical protein
VARSHEEFFESHPHYLLLFHQARGLLQLHPKHAKGDERLIEVFADYLATLGERLLAEDERARWSVDDKIDLAAVMVGAITGYRSFRIASGLPGGRTTAEAVLSGGIPQALRSRAAPVQ